MIRPKTQKLKISQSLLNQVSTARFDLSQTSYIGLLTHKSATLWRGDRLKAWLPCRPRADTHRAHNHREGRQDKQDRHDNTERKDAWAWAWTEPDRRTDTWTRTWTDERSQTYRDTTDRPQTYRRVT
jgi:hypothetical protein